MENKFIGVPAGFVLLIGVVAYLLLSPNVIVSERPALEEKSVVLQSSGRSTDDDSTGDDLASATTKQCAHLGIAAGGACSPSSTRRCASGSDNRGRPLACEYYCNSRGVIETPTDCYSRACNAVNTACLLGTE